MSDLDRLFEIARENDIEIEARDLEPPVEALVIGLTDGRRYVFVDLREDADDERLAMALIRSLGVALSLDLPAALRELPVIPWHTEVVIRGKKLGTEAEHRANLIRRQLEGITC